MVLIETLAISAVTFDIMNFKEQQAKLKILGYKVGETKIKDCVVVGKTKHLYQEEELQTT